HQEKSLVMNNGSFARELCDSRTFCRQADVDAMQANGLALGGHAGENAVVFDGDQVLSPGGLRHADEPVRHKMLDALGDLALAGAPLIGHYTGVRAGHSLTNTLLRALFATPGAVRMVECDAQMASRLPGFGLEWDEIPAVA
ncbi:MAG: UDP-3-O-[3-hydroxymyristoyl] N-acetylglucosamine deacetylase, partial [Sulfitobacter sp.]|nr:UDP-3-O-[3-hydroxymyristoyl] N-acetylglucosamine deacetylase [Sulfitobacter sp.]